MIDWRRLGQGVLVQACEDAKLTGDLGNEARNWLTRPSNGLREAILYTTTSLAQDDLDRLVERHGGSTWLDR